MSVQALSILCRGVGNVASFPERLYELRIEWSLTQDELGRVIDTTGQQVSKYERGRRKPPTNKLEQLADYFGVSTDYLLGRTDRREPIDLSRHDIRRAGFPIPPEGWDQLSDEEKQEVEEITRIAREAAARRAIERKLARERDNNK